MSCLDSVCRAVITRIDNPGGYEYTKASGTVSNQDILITQDDFEFWTAITGLSEANFNRIARLASAKVENYLDRKLLYKENMFEAVRSGGGNSLELSLYPIHQVKFFGSEECLHSPSSCDCSDHLTIEDDGMSGVLTSTRALKKSSRTVAMEHEYRFNGPNTFPDTWVLYSGGYILEDSYTPPDDEISFNEDCQSCFKLPLPGDVHVMPEVIRQVISAEAARIYNGRSRVKCHEPSIKRERIDEYEIEYFSPKDLRGNPDAVSVSSGLSQSSREALQPYRRIF